MKKLLIIFVLLTNMVLAQVEKIQLQPLPNTAYFMHNKLIYNPASAGTGISQFNVGLMARFQLIGYEGAPFTNLFWTDFKIPAYKMALGATVFQEKIGSYQNTEAMFNYSYFINLNESLKLSMGLRAGFTNSQFAPGKMFDSENVPIVNVNIPKFGMGFQLYDSKFFVSLSSPDMVIIDSRNVFSENNSKNFFNRSRNYILSAGYRLKLGDLYAINPNIFQSYHTLGGYRTSANLLFEITDYFWGGGTITLNNDIKNTTSTEIYLMAGTNISSRIKFGYSYGFSSTGLYAHEINLQLTFDNLFKKKAE